MSRQSRRFAYRLCLRLGVLLLAVLHAPQNPLLDLVAPAPTLARVSAAEAMRGPALPMDPMRKVAPPTDPHLPSLAIAITVNPDPVSVGTPTTITLTVTNNAPDPATSLTVTLPVPGGAEAQPGPGLASPQTGWRWTQASLAPKSKATFTATMRVPALPLGEALVVLPTATATGLTAPVRATGGALVASPMRATASRSISTDAGDTLTSGDGRVRVELPARLGTVATTVTHSHTPPAGEAAPPVSTAGRGRGFGTFYLQATDAGGRAVHRLPAPVAVTLRYTPEQVQALGIPESALTLFWYNPDAKWTDGGGKERTGRWVAIPSTVDRKTRTVSARVEHFSTFHFGDGSPLTDAFVPGLDEWQVSGFTGSLAYTVPLAAPAGPAGLRPDLRLSYNSAATDGASGERPLQQAGWAGKGWSLDPGAISLLRTAEGGSAGYTLVLGGKSFVLYRGASLSGATDKVSDYAWQTSDENFLRVRAEYLGETDPARASSQNGTFHRYTWHLWTKTGLHYEFADDAWWGFKYCNPNESGGAYGWMEAYTWKLSRVTDPHGNAITYTYDRTPPQSDATSCYGLVGTVDTDIWLTAVTWGGPQCRPTPGATLAGCYQARFTSGARAYDTQPELLPMQYGPPPTQTRVLLAVDFYAWPTGLPSPETAAALEQNRVHSYYLGYADGTTVPTLLSDSAPNYAPDPTTPKYTLTSITLVGRNGFASPATSFTYGGDRGTLPYPNGDWNRLTQVENGQGGSATFAYQSIGVEHSAFNNYRRVVAKSVSDGRTPASVWGYRYTNPELNSVGRAIDSAATPAEEPQYTPNSATLYLNRYFTPGAISYDFNVANPTHAVFRGHRTTTAIAPNGRQTTHWFYQGDTEDDPRDPLHGCAPNPATVSGNDVNTYLGDPCFLLLRDNEFRVGRAYRTEVRGTEGEGSPLLSRVERTDAVQAGAADLQGVYPSLGVWHAWVRQTAETTTVYENGETSPSKTSTTTYGYDPAKQGAGGTQYGHLTDVQVFEGTPGPNSTPYRMSQRWYAANDTATAPGTPGQPAFADARYLVDFAWQSVRADGAGTAVTREQTTYDGLSAGQVGAKGESTRTRAFYDLGANLGRDEAFTYDSYGNVATVTTFAQPNGGGAARQTTMTYDPVFHRRLTGVTLPSVGGIALTESAEYDPVLGVLTKIIDPNGAVTTATYDGLRRITAVVAPGGSAMTPTKQYLYRFGSATAPGRVVTVSSVGTYTLRFLDGRGRAIQTKQLDDAAGGSYRSAVADAGYDAMGAVERTSQPRYASENGTAFWEYTPQADAGTMRWTVAQRDVRGRITRSTAPDGSYGTASYAVGSLGPAVIGTDANRHQTRREEDIWGRLRLVTEYLGDGAGAAYAPYATTTYDYDVADRLVREEDDKHNVTTHSYDGLGRVLSTVDADRGTTTATYDVNGNVTQTQDGAMHTIGYGYDALNRLVSESGGVTASYLWDRDPAYPGEANTLGRLVTSVTGPTGTPTAKTHTTYDARGRKLTAGATIRGVNAAFDYAYDDGNRVTALTHPQAAGASSREAVTYAYDLASRPLSLCAGSTCYAGNMGYTALSQPVTRTAGNGAVEQWTYDGPLARLARHQIGTSPQSPSDRDDRGYEYDAGGNVTKIASTTLGEEQHYAYDARDRLTRAWTTGASSAPYDETYEYDTVGDLTVKAGTTYDYAGSGHAHAPKTVGGDSYTYDAAGNTLTGGGRSYEWNAQGLPTKITTGAGSGTSMPTPTPGGVPNLTNGRGGATVAGAPNLTANRAGAGWTTTPPPNLVAPGRTATGVVEEYGYDAGGGRVWRVHEGVVTLYFGLVEVDVTPNTTMAVATRAFYRFGGIVAQRERRGSTESVAYLHGDHLGSVGVVTGAGGSLVSRTEYGPWGQVRANSTGSKPTTIDYTGQLRDGTGLVYMGARYYDPVIGRFVSADSYGGRVGVPQSHNRYAYVLNNPLIHTDPTGHCEDECGDPSDPGSDPGDPSGDPGPDPGGDPSTDPGSDPDPGASTEGDGGGEPGNEGEMGDGGNPDDGNGDVDGLDGNGTDPGIGDLTGDATDGGDEAEGLDDGGGPEDPGDVGPELYTATAAFFDEGGGGTGTGNSIMSTGRQDMVLVQEERIVGNAGILTIQATNEVRDQTVIVTVSVVLNPDIQATGSFDVNPKVDGVPVSAPTSGVLGAGVPEQTSNRYIGTIPFYYGLGDPSQPNAIPVRPGERVVFTAEVTVRAQRTASLAGVPLFAPDKARGGLTIDFTVPDPP